MPDSPAAGTPDPVDKLLLQVQQALTLAGYPMATNYGLRVLSGGFRARASLDRSHVKVEAVVPPRVTGRPEEDEHLEQQLTDYLNLLQWAGHTVERAAVAGSQYAHLQVVDPEQQKTPGLRITEGEAKLNFMLTGAPAVRLPNGAMMRPSCGTLGLLVTYGRWDASWVALDGRQEQPDGALSTRAGSRVYHGAMHRDEDAGGAPEWLKDRLHPVIEHLNAGGEKE